MPDEIRCPHCGGTESYRLRKNPAPTGEVRTCQKCWRNFDYQTEEEKRRVDDALARYLVRREESLKKIAKQIEAKEAEIKAEEAEGVRES